VNPLLKKDLKALEDMVDKYDHFVNKLLDPELPHQERQAAEAALVMLKEFISNKTRDIRRRGRENRKY